MMACTCIKDHAKALKGRFGPDAHLINTRHMMNFESGKTWLEMEPLRFRYHKKNKDGTFSKKWTSSWVNNNYCALCGKKKKK